MIFRFYVATCSRPTSHVSSLFLGCPGIPLSCSTCSSFFLKKLVVAIKLSIHLFFLLAVVCVFGTRKIKKSTAMLRWRKRKGESPLRHSAISEPSSIKNHKWLVYICSPRGWKKKNQIELFFSFAIKRRRRSQTNVSHNFLCVSVCVVLFTWCWIGILMTRVDSMGRKKKKKKLTGCTQAAAILAWRY